MPEQDPVDFRLDRTIHVRWNGVESTGPLTAGPIRWLPERGRWACYWSVHAIHSEEAKIYGSDPLDALNNALHFVASLIHGSIDDGIQLWWQYEGDACGFRRPRD